MLQELGLLVLTFRKHKKCFSNTAPHKSFSIDFMNKRITDLPAITTVDAAADPLPIVDVSDTSQSVTGTTKKVTVIQIDQAIIAAGNKAIVIDNVAALKALTVSGIADGQLYITRGYYSDNDGGQGTYIYDSASAASDNGGTVIAPTSGSGRFLLQYGVEINVKQFGAKGDGITDDTSALNSAASQAASIQKKLVIPQTSSGYKSTATLDFRDVEFIESYYPSILSSVTTTPAVRIGGNSTMIANGSISISVTRPSESNDWTSGSVGVQLEKATNCRFSLMTRGFYDGVKICPGSSQYVTYCKFELCNVSRCFNNWNLCPTSNGFIISNTWSGGVNYQDLNEATNPNSHVYIKTVSSSFVSDNLWTDNIDFDGNSSVYGTSASSCALFRFYPDGNVGGTLNNKVVNCRQESSTSTSDVCVVNIETTTNKRIVEFSAQFNNVTSKLFPIIADQLTKNLISINTGNLETPVGPSDIISASSLGALIPVFTDASGNIKAPGRIIYRASTAAYVDSLSSGSQVAIGDEIVTWNSDDYGIGFAIKKEPGYPTWINVSQGTGNPPSISVDLAVFCFDSNGVQLSGSSPAYAVGNTWRTKNIGSSNFYQMNGGWIYLHKDVASAIIVSSPWNFPNFKYVDLLIQYTSGNPIAFDRVPGFQPSNIISGGAPKSYFQSGTVIGDNVNNVVKLCTFNLATATSSSASSGASAVVVSSVSGVSNGDTVLVQVDSTVNNVKKFDAFTVSSVAGSTVNLSGTLSAAVSSGNVVYFNRWTDR